jgi:hypothetical protein
MTRKNIRAVASQPENPALPDIIPWSYLLANSLFGILNLGLWDLFDIWFLVLGIFIIYFGFVG